MTISDSYIVANDDTSGGDQDLSKSSSILKATDPAASNDPERQGLLGDLRGSLQEWYRRERTPEEVRRRNICFGLLVVAILITCLGVLIASLKKVDETTYGVQYNVHKKQLDDAAKSGGLFFGPPGYEFIKFPSTFITVDLKNRTCVSRDGLLVVFTVTFQYKMTEANVLPAILKYRNFEKWAGVVEAAGLSAIHHSCGNYNISAFQNKRGEIQGNMEDNLRLKLEGDVANSRREGVYAMVVSLQLENVDLPVEYNAAVQEKQSAQEDISLARNERAQAITKAQTENLRAAEEAKKILDTANNDADVLLTEARLKGEETTYAFEKEAETILDVKTSLNLTTEGVLAYLYSTLLADVANLSITSGEPARLSRSDEL